MRKLKNDFAQPVNPNEVWYDLHDDWDLIEASMAKQYGIRLRNEAQTMIWAEFVTLVSGLMYDTPLGSIISIRSEKDLNAIKAFTPDQRRIRSDWATRTANERLKDPETLDRDMNQMYKMFAKMFGEEAKA